MLKLAAASTGAGKFRRRRARPKRAVRHVLYDAKEKSTAKDLAGALYGIVAKHPEPEDVLYAMMQMHKKDASNAFKAALQAFGVTWERKTKSPEKVPA